MLDLAQLEALAAPVVPTEQQKLVQLNKVVAELKGEPIEELPRSVSERPAWWMPTPKASVWRRAWMKP